MVAQFQVTPTWKLEGECKCNGECKEKKNIRPSDRVKVSLVDLPIRYFGCTALFFPWWGWGLCVSGRIYCRLLAGTFYNNIFIFIDDNFAGNLKRRKVSILVDFENLISVSG